MMQKFRKKSKFELPIQQFRSERLLTSVLEAPTRGSSSLQNEKPTISIVVPALNEEKNIEGAILKAIRLCQGRVSAYEIIAINDGSTDKTGQIISGMAKENRNIIELHHSKPWGFGGTYNDGLNKAKYEYFSLIPGDNEEIEAQQDYLYSHLGKAELIISYTTNMEVRPRDRELISKAFTLYNNLVYGLDLQYYNGSNIIKTKLLKNLKMHTYGFAYSASNVVRLVKSGHSFIEVGVKIKAPTNSTKAYKAGNIISVAKEVVRLFCEVNLLDSQLYNKPINRIDK